MNINNPKYLTREERNLLRFKHYRKVPIPEKWAPYLWSYQKHAPLEALIVQVCNYGKFEDIQNLYKLYPEETAEVVFRRPDIRRGIKFWIKRWKK